ncbi:hypothetical protein H4R19_003024 [Coemansia spiralis]|nr:hypothetical protein H4R19_003024 [Coemansia spiralis]
MRGRHCPACATRAVYRQRPPVHATTRSQAAPALTHTLSSGRLRCSMPPNIEFRDAANAVLFRESLSSDYPLEDVFAQYYPDAPPTLLFYVHGGIALPRQTTLRSLHGLHAIRELPVVVWARMPVSADPTYSPQWRSAT